MNKNTFTTLALGAAIMASCTLEKDAQHGISFEFRHPNQHIKSEVRDQPERIASTPASVSSPEAATSDWVAAPAATYAVAPSEFWNTPSADNSYDEPASEEPIAIANDAPAAADSDVEATEESAVESVAVAKKKGWAQRLVEFMAPDNEMVIAALLAFFLGGFGAHWFYLGERGRGMARLLVTLGAGLLYIIGYVMAVLSLAAGGTGLLGGVLFLMGLLALLANSILVIIDLVKILTDNW
jgi:TM2 domain-containing membrane protein YozV